VPTPHVYPDKGISKLLQPFEVMAVERGGSSTVGLERACKLSWVGAVLYPASDILSSVINLKTIALVLNLLVLKTKWPLIASSSADVIPQAMVAKQFVHPSTLQIIYSSTIRAQSIPPLSSFGFQN
jgi:hypothetical protein